MSKSLDLTPYEEFTTKGAAGRAGLEGIALAPLQQCQKLHTLVLSQNALRYITLDPLQHCSNLKILRIANNCLKKIQFTPLQHCKELVEVDISGNSFDELSSVDISPLFDCPNLALLKISSHVNIIVLSKLRELEMVPKGIKALWDRIQWKEPG